MDQHVEWVLSEIERIGHRLPVPHQLVKRETGVYDVVVADSVIGRIVRIHPPGMSARWAACDATGMLLPGPSLPDTRSEAIAMIATSPEAFRVRDSARND